MDTNYKPNDWREARRFQALALKAKGWTQAKIAEALGVSAGAVSQWFKLVHQKGDKDNYFRLLSLKKEKKCK